MGEADFSGYATKANLVCSDGRTIKPEAFQHMDGVRVPLVWQHGHNNAENVLGHAILEARDDGMYAYGYFNETPQGNNAKTLVSHGDIQSLSIYANRLVEKAKQVFHGVIQEVSLVLAGANPGALIDYVNVVHSDGSVEIMEEEAVIYSNVPLEHAMKTYVSKETVVSTETVDGEVVATRTSTNESTRTRDDGTSTVAYSDLGHADKTVQEVYDSLSDEQKTVVNYMIGAALEQVASHSDNSNDLEDTNEDVLEHQEGTNNMGTKRNVFEQNESEETGPVLSHSDLKGIVAAASKTGSMKAAFEEYALAHGIDDIDLLFPDAKALDNVPEWNKRRTEWVAGVLSGTRHSPFSRIKTLSADITHDEARAKGYIKGNFKKEEFFGLLKRVTTPTTVYKKQKLDRDDVIDITTIDVVAWLKGEMRLMLEEELARAILIGDGRDVADEDKISESNIRPIAKEAELYCTTLYVNLDDASSSTREIVDTVIRNRKHYKGTGTPTFYTTEDVVSAFLLLRDNLGRREYRNLDEVAADLRVDRVVPVEVMEDEPGLIGIIVNLQDYVVGADKGGEVSMFDDFDIDYNQMKYLIETRLSGALTKIKAALVLRKVAAAAVLVVPVEPSFDGSHVVIPTVTGVVYKNALTNATLANGSTVTLTSGQTLSVTAVPATNYFFETSDADWEFAYSV